MDVFAERWNLQPQILPLRVWMTMRLWGASFASNIDEERMSTAAHGRLSGVAIKAQATGGLGGAYLLATASFTELSGTSIVPTLRDASS